MAKNSIWFNLFFKKRVFLQHCFMDLKHAREWPDQASQAILFLFMLSRLHNLIMPHALRVSLLLTHKRTGSYVFDLLSCNSFYTYHHSGGKPFYDDMEKKWLDFVSIPGAAGVGCWWHLPFDWWAFLLRIFFTSNSARTLKHCGFCLEAGLPRGPQGKSSSSFKRVWWPIIFSRFYNEQQISSLEWIHTVHLFQVQKKEESSEINHL